MSDCEKCLWRGQCHTQYNCPDFTPVEEDVDSAVESDKYDYRKAFFSYDKEEGKNFYPLNNFI